VSGASFTEHTTGRPFVTGIDVKASRRTGAVVALGDSLTDGYDGSPIGVPETRDGVDANGRYTDVLARRLRSAGRPLSVLNMGMTGNRVLSNAGGNFGPSALSRLGTDVIRQSGVTTVIWIEGLNDIGQTPSAGVPDLIAGWKRGIAKMHRAGLRVLLGTLPPTGSADIREDAMEDKRQRLNEWIRTARVADGVIDADAALRDPALPNRVNPAYAGSDRLHLNLAGNRALGNAVPLRRLRLPACARR
jgi:lysophospholipase L1-like esterase